ncbi:MAG TPA: hypothetical protein VGM82_21970 [Gemmatimonadaceae bacterium]|jgi:ElaB/YqjD/DUF883 family membrane-anchored ribosome-binding protein
MENANDMSTDDLSQSRTASSTTGSTNTTASNITDRARELAGSAQDKLADVGSNVRERAGHMKDSLADALETGADKLRAKGSTQSSSTALAGATGSSSVALDADGRVAQVTSSVAGGMDATADWLRQADLDGLRATVEQQVKEHPGRSLLIAAGVGYLLGKALRK